MRDFHCRDLDLNCEFVARGDTTDEVLGQTELHMEDAHHMPVTLELAETVKWLIHDRTSPAHLDSIQRSS